ncbi:hypothetical protein [Krasilnikovia sp. MM14-A1259]|uniref:hypothetical protein n=1 Tax=Krasilnikovia sp. MM14-A1259 TaxID=3373539 RepID=UPI00380EA2EB
MLFPSDNGPSLLVKDGETVTLSTDRAEEDGLTALRLRPLTAAALHRAFGTMRDSPPRLSDERAFERVEDVGGLVDLSHPDDDGRIGGFTMAALHNMLSVIDPDAHLPTHISWPPVADQLSDMAAGSPPSRHVSAEFSSMKLRIPLPKFVADLSSHFTTLLFRDIVVESGATLVLEKDLNHLWAGNFVAYNGARIVQRSSFLTIDVMGRLRGGLLNLSHVISDHALELLDDVIDAHPVELP